MSRTRAAIVGATIGLTTFAVALVFRSGDESVPWLVAASIPAGLIAGAAVGSSIRSNEPIRSRVVFGGALIADLVGIVVVSSGAAIDASAGPYPPETPLPITILGFTGLGLVSYGWFASLPVAVFALIGGLLVRSWEERVTSHD